MRICHVTAHLPPDQSANALLPVHLGTWAREAGDEPSFIAHPPRSLDGRDAGALTAVAAALPGPVTWIDRRRALPRQPGISQVSSLIELFRIWLATRPRLASADLVHVHSNGLLPEAVAWLAARRGLPTVLTLYGTEIWHYTRKRFVDPFTRAYRSAAHVTFYSRALLDKAIECGLTHDHLSVIYPPVAEYFHRRDEDQRRAARFDTGLSEQCVIVNVKRLHTLAGQIHLINAMPAVLRVRPDCRLVICGTGPLRQQLEARAAELGVSGHVTLTGLIDNRRVALYQSAADLFVLPSELEALPTVAIEALASGTPVVSTDNPGGVELHRLFEDDVALVPRGDAGALAAAMTAFLESPRRTRPRTERVLREVFSPASVAQRFAAIYRDACRQVRSADEGGRSD